jgi:hypothetical protein
LHMKATKACTYRHLQVACEPPRWSGVRRSSLIPSWTPPAWPGN